MPEYRVMMFRILLDLKNISLAFLVENGKWQQLEVLTPAIMVLIVFNSKVPSSLKLQRRRKKRKLAHGRSRRRLKTNGLKINVPGSHQKCPTINRTNKTQLKVARFNWNKHEIFSCFSSPEKLEMENILKWDIFIFPPTEARFCCS